MENAELKFPTDVIFVRRLTIIKFEGCLSVDSQVFSEILSTGNQLESLTLSGILECTLSVNVVLVVSRAAPNYHSKFRTCREGRMISFKSLLCFH